MIVYHFFHRLFLAINDLSTPKDWGRHRVWVLGDGYHQRPHWKAAWQSLLSVLLHVTLNGLLVCLFVFCPRPPLEGYTHECGSCTYFSRWSIILVEYGNKPMHDLKIPEKLADLPEKPGRLFSLEEIAETRAYFDRCRSSGPGCLWFILQKMFFLFSDLCPGDNSLENQGVAAHDYAIHTYLIEVISCVTEIVNGVRVQSDSCCCPLWVVHLDPGLHGSPSVNLSSASLAFPLIIFPLCLQDDLSSSPSSWNLIIPCFMISWYSIFSTNINSGQGSDFSHPLKAYKKTA